MYIVPDSQIMFDGELSHHGILGMKWGIRRFQPYKKGEKKGKEVDEASKKRKKIVKGVAITAGTVAAVSAVVYALREVKIKKMLTGIYKSHNDFYNFKTDKKKSTYFGNINNYDEMMRNINQRKETINNFVAKNPKAKKIISKDDLNDYKEFVKDLKNKNIKIKPNRYSTLNLFRYN